VGGSLLWAAQQLARVDLREWNSLADNGRMQLGAAIERGLDEGAEALGVGQRGEEEERGLGRSSGDEDGG